MEIYICYILAKVVILVLKHLTLEESSYLEELSCRSAQKRSFQFNLFKRIANIKATFL